MRGMSVKKSGRRFTEPELGAPEEEVLHRYANWVGKLASKELRKLPPHVVSSHASMNDLMQEGNMALIKCWRNYVIAKPGVTFVTYAFLRVRGAMIDYYRDRRKHLKNQPPVLVSWNDGVKDETYPGTFPEPADVTQIVDVNIAMSCLHDWEVAFLDLLYVERWTLKSIGSIRGVTESRASQIHKAILIKMRRHLGLIPEAA
jgi:RNA polymerase sigma factor (sigma-70 family)